jgi:O-antigen/teichoic acid export membrane protein
MRLGQTAVVLFLSKVITSFLGFLSTIYFARTLGAGTLGVYFLGLTVVSWLQLFGTIGYRLPGKKRISETKTEESEFALASLLIAISSFVVIAVFLLVFREQVNTYVGTTATQYLIGIVFMILLFRYIATVLQGKNRVHTFAVVRTVGSISRVSLQVFAIFLGFGVTGLFIGYAAGFFVAIVLGIVYISIKFRLPRKNHFRRLFSYAKYSWLYSFQGRTFSYMDIFVLGIFVSSDFIGIYQISWQLASFLVIFTSSVSQTLFPEMSRIAENEDKEQVAGLLRDSLAYTGIFVIPGLVGGLLLGADILRIYGAEFTTGGSILAVLLVSRLVYAYQSQIINTINAIDRPDLGFRINVAFIVVNVSLNFILVWQFGWIGAAVATAVSAGLALVLGHHYITQLIPVQWPVRQISLQWVAALVMGVVLLPVLAFRDSVGTVTTPTVDLAATVSFGAIVYFFTLSGISTEFREIVQDNVPVDVLN